MGAKDFMTSAYGVSANAAFRSAVEAAQHENGHGGYTGTIAEKHSFTEVGDLTVVNAKDERAACKAAGDLARALMQEDEDTNDDPEDDRFGKFSPAGCIEVRPPGDGRPGLYLFFGVAAC